MVPWYFGYDHLNDAWYFPVYIYEILDVPDTHPSIAQHLAVGDFVVQQQNQNSFSQTSMEQTIEQTINRDSKTSDGQIEFSNNAYAIHRWILSFNQRAKISRSCPEMTGKSEACYKIKDLSKSRYEKDEVDIQNFMHTIESMQNPFTYNEKELINIASGQEAPSEIIDDILTAHEKSCNGLFL